MQTDDPREIRFLELQARGLNAKQIAQEMGVTPRTVQRWRGKLNLAKKNTGPWPQDIRDKAKALLDGGASYREVGRTLGPSARAIAKWFPGYGWTFQQAGSYAQMVLLEKELERKKRG